MRTPEEIKRGLECCQTYTGRSCKPCPYVRLEHCLSELNASALAYIQQLESAQPKWISVEERLPEEKMAVLVYGQRRVFNGKKIETFPMVHVAFLDEGWFAWDSEDVIEVTHWMPLPSTEGIE